MYKYNISLVEYDFDGNTNAIEDVHIIVMAKNAEDAINKVQPLLDYEFIMVNRVSLEVMTADQLINEHNRFIYQKWDVEKMRKEYPLEILALHVLLCEEYFYYKDKEMLKKALAKLRDVYPTAKKSDLMRVYDKYKDIVGEIYG